MLATWLKNFKVVQKQFQLKALTSVTNSRFRIELWHVACASFYWTTVNTASTANKLMTCSNLPLLQLLPVLCLWNTHC